MKIQLSNEFQLYYNHYVFEIPNILLFSEEVD